MDNAIQLLPKQAQCWDTIYDDHTTEILYWGWVGSGKSFLICLYIASELLAYPWCRIALCREELKKLKLSTLNTLFAVFEQVGIKPKGYRYNENMWTITLQNKSQVVLVDLAYRPSDPDYAYLGSSEYTSALIDEAQEINGKAKETLISRIRHLKSKAFYKSQDKKAVEDWIAEYNKKNNASLFLEEVSIEGFVTYEAIMWKKEKPLLLMSCNPWKNFLYKEFYMPHKNDEMPDFRCFIPALPTDNPYLWESYIKSLYNMEEERKQRLLYGNWEYNEDESYLFPKPIIWDMFTRKANIWETYYITWDVARQGKDKTILCIWKGLHCFRIETLEKQTFTQQKVFVQDLMKQYGISIDNVVLDGAWMGIWLVEMLGCRWFIGNSSPFSPYSAKIVDYHKRNYSNLRSQCYFYLQKIMKDEKISIQCDSDIQNLIAEELLFIKQTNIEDDTKAAIEKKSEIKSNLGRSPDYADSISMISYFIIKNISYGNAEDIFEDEQKKESPRPELDKIIRETLEWKIEQEVWEIELSAF